ncbi:hypothetical protein J7E78_29195 [Paenibacillus polymyxa]|uniref:hypothetical protein n=1 Tax=Paenibacillus polymyxa TaxID=1406 RepID=UPI001BEB7B48|nr:hypothetical protein [Paenibacillus polymyxa]MBT2287536.1 hypothetical protein [Paenibacillus polymyxa]
MYFGKKLIMGMLSFLLIAGCLAGAVVAKDSKAKGFSIDVTSDSTLIPGQGISVNVGILNTGAPHENGDVQSATIVLSYDENIFATDEDEVLRFDETLGKYIWRDDAFIIPTDYFESKDYTIQNPEPADLDPNDGKQEIIISISAKNGKSISSSSGEAFISFHLKTKEDSLNKQTSIEVLPAMTLLVNHNGESIQNYNTTPANIFVSMPKNIFVVAGTMRPDFLPFIFSLNDGNELNALAYFENGDAVYVTDMVTWHSTNTEVLKPHGNGNVQAVGLGTASIKVTFGSITGEKMIKVVTPATAAILNAEPEPYATVVRSDSKPIEVQVIINGKIISDSGRIVNGSVYIPLRAISESFGVVVGYDSSKKLPVLYGSPLTQSRNISGISYVKAKDLPSLLGANIKWSNATKKLYIEYPSKP